MKRCYNIKKKNLTYVRFFAISHHRYSSDPARIFDQYAAGWYIIEVSQWMSHVKSSNKATRKIDNCGKGKDS